MVLILLNTTLLGQPQHAASVFDTVKHAFAVPRSEVCVTSGSGLDLYAENWLAARNGLT